MGAISGYGFSRGNYAQILRARNDSRSEQGRNVKTKNDKTQNEKGRGDKGRNDELQKTNEVKTDDQPAEVKARLRSNSDHTTTRALHGLVSQSTVRYRGNKIDARVDDLEGKVNDRFVATDKKIDDLGKKQDAIQIETNGRIDDLGKEVDSRFDDLEGKIGSQFDSTNTKIDDLGNAVDDRLDKTDQKIDDLGNQVNDRLDKTDQKIDDLSNNVDDKLNDLSDKLGNQVNDVAGDLASAVKDLKDVIKDVDTQNDSQLSDTVKDLKDDFNKQFSDLKSQHEAESAALLAKLDEVTSALKTLSEQSSEQISVLKDKLGGLGGQLGTVINKIDLLSQGGGMSHRSLGLYNAAAKVGNGALDKLVGIVGGKSGNQLRGVQSQLNAVSARYGGAGQGAGGLSLLA